MGRKKLYFSADEYNGSRGDIVFFDTNSDQKADRTAIAISKSKDILIVIEGDVDGAVDEAVYQNFDNILGYGKTSSLYEAEHILNSSEKYSNETSVKAPELSGRINKYIPSIEEKPVMFKMTKNTPLPDIYDSEPLMLMSYIDDDYNIDEEFTLDEGIIFTSELEQEIIHASIKTLSGVELSDGATVYLGETYLVSLGFSEINTGSEWVQFRHNEDGYLTYQIPSNINCKPLDEWHTISAKTENGTVADVGEYYLDETGLLKVRFYEDENGVNFVKKYSNVDFTIDFNATVADFEAGNSTEIEFNDKLNLNLVVDGNATMDVVKSHGKYNADDNTMEYTIKVEATHGVVKDLVINDEIWENHYTLRDTIVVTDLEGTLLTLSQQFQITLHTTVVQMKALAFLASLIFLLVTVF